MPKRPSQAPCVGRILNDHYRLEERIGQGGMGIVFRATDLRAERMGRERSSKVAIKVLKPELKDREAALFDEVEDSKTLQQENIVDVYGFESDDAGGFMVMELLSGEPLDQCVTNRYSDGMPFAIALPLIKGMGAALTYAHRRNVIHSDFKPSNVLVIGASVKVLDFGIARAARSGGGISAGERPVGLTPEFASCEMLERQPADKRDDVYCFALVVYFVLSGKHPFDGARATDARDDKLPVPPIAALSKRQNAALRRALSFSRFDRTPTIDEVVQELAAGQKAPISPGLWTALGATVLVAGALGYLYVDRVIGYQDSDDQFILDLCKNSSSRPMASAGDQDVFNTLMDQGNNYLRDGLKPLDPGLLSENVSSALGAYTAALNFGGENCETAARGVLKVATAYKDEARRLYKAREYVKAEQMTKMALRIWGGSTDMQNLLYKIKARVGQEPEEPG